VLAKVAKNAHWLCYIHLSICPHILTQLLLGGFLWNFILGTSMKRQTESC